MFDLELQEQLRVAFAKLESKIELTYDVTSHADQNQLVEFLEAVAATSPRIAAIAAKRNQVENSDQAPGFGIRKNGTDLRVSFVGIPTGHEFTSLVLAILNADGKGKFPDSAILNRVSALKGPIALRTYISLTCENCPEVVQALNMMALVHPEISHQMIDGGYAQADIEKLNIQGVPCVMAGDKLIHSGKAGFVELLSKLEVHFGTSGLNVGNNLSTDLGDFDVIVVGSGPAGASAAIYTARKGLKTAIVADRFGGQVQDTKGIENLISVPYTEGPKLAEQLRAHVAEYPIAVFEHRRVESASAETRVLVLDSGERLTGKAIVVATGAKWRELGVPGEKEYLGRGVAFCPHCDGPFYRGKKVAVIGGGNSGVEAAIDLAGIVGEVVLVEYSDKLRADQILVEKLKSLSNARIIVSAKTIEISGDGKTVTGLKYLNRLSEKIEEIPLNGVFVQIGLLPNSQAFKGIFEISPQGEIVVDGKGHTSTPGFYAAGDVTTVPYKQIVIAIGEGAKAGLAVFEDQLLKG